jgi:phage baseplate assembly protein W
LSLLPTLDDFKGLSSATGAEISGDDHLRQSIRDILTTPLGTRVMRRNYGSRLFDLVDAPMTPGRVADIVAGVAEALAAWEPRLILKTVLVQLAAAGRFSLDLIVVSNGKTVQLQGVL